MPCLSRRSPREDRRHEPLARQFRRGSRLRTEGCVARSRRVCVRPVEARPRQNPQGEGLLCQPAVSEDRVTDARLASAVPGYRWAMEAVPLRVYKALPAGNVLVASTGANSSPDTWKLPGRMTCQRPRACRTGSSMEVAECMETPGAPMLVSQQSNPQPVRACLAASTFARSRPGEGRQSGLADGTQQTSQSWSKALLGCILWLPRLTAVPMSHKSSPTPSSRAVTTWPQPCHAS